MSLALGTPVVYTHQAAVARKGKPGMWNRGWFLPEKGNGVVPSYVWFRGVDTEPDVVLGSPDELLGPTLVSFVGSDGQALSPATVEKVNKATVVWEAEGSGVVCGLETKHYGVSHSGGGEDGGWLDNYGQVKLYVVRSRLEGREFAYVPTWAARPVVLSAV